MTFTLECSGSNGLPFFTSGIGNAQWAGASLADVLKEAAIKGEATEAVFFGADKGPEVLRAGTPGELKFTAHFARSMSIDDAMSPDNILCYEMNGQPLPAAHGAPVRLIAPGWFGIANVKWLHRIEVRNTRFAGRFMGRDYVTVREEERDGEMVVEETSVSHMLLKSAPAQVHTERWSLSHFGYGLGAGSRSPLWKSRSMTAPRSRPLSQRRTNRRLRGDRGISTGQRRRGSTWSPLARLTTAEACNRRWMIR